MSSVWPTREMGILWLAGNRMQFDRLKRREFIALLGGAAAVWPVATRGQERVPVVGFLNGASPTELGARVAAFRDGLAESTSKATM